MHSPQLRTILRDATSDAHAKLDASVGLFDTNESYSAYLKNTAQFRGAVEEVMGRQSLWTPQSIYPLLQLDLADLGVSEPRHVSFSGRDRSDDLYLGVAYVLEGSGLGARLLVRRAETLGFTAHHGARHLVAQASDKERWPLFLGLLGVVEEGKFPDIVRGAQECFDFALSIYAGECV